MAEFQVSMKLLIDTQSKRVLFAEADNECVDFLFYILSMPVATVITLLKKQEMIGSLANLYDSVENLNESYIQPNQTKDNLLKPMVPDRNNSAFAPLLLLKDHNAPKDKKFYKCTYCNGYVSDDPRTNCPGCKTRMTTNMSYIAYPAGEPSSTGVGFVKGVVTYMVMDDLVVTPMSTISSINMLNKFNVKEVGSLQEKVVNLGMDEAVKLLKASLQTKRVLTDVFFNPK